MGHVWNAFFRSFLIQSSWNFERMQSLGFFYSINPALKAIHKTEGSLKEASKRHLEFFNTNPYMAPAIIGATIRLEESGAPDEEIKGLKTALMGAYGAIGDTLFWGSLRPLAAVAGVIIALNGFLWAPAVFLAIFNLPHIFIRYYGIVKGYKTGNGIVSAIMLLNIPDKVKKLKLGILFLAGILLAVLLSSASGKTLTFSWMFLIPIFSIIAFYWGIERGVRVEFLAVMSVAISVGLSLLF